MKKKEKIKSVTSLVSGKFIKVNESDNDEINIVFSKEIISDLTTLESLAYLTEMSASKKKSTKKRPCTRDEDNKKYSTKEKCDKQEEHD